MFFLQTHASARPSVSGTHDLALAARLGFFSVGAHLGKRGVRATLPPEVSHVRVTIISVDQLV